MDVQGAQQGFITLGVLQALHVGVLVYQHHVFLGLALHVFLVQLVTHTRYAALLRKRFMLAFVLAEKPAHHSLLAGGFQLSHE